MGSYGLASHFSSLKEICRGMPRLGNQAAFNTSSQASLDMLRSVLQPACSLVPASHQAVTAGGVCVRHLPPPSRILFLGTKP